MTVFQNYREIFRVTDKGGALKTPIMKIGAGSNITITRPKDISGLYELDEVIISANPANAFSGEMIDDDIYALLQALNDEVL
jgi:hypothetical protein